MAFQKRIFKWILLSLLLLVLTALAGSIALFSCWNSPSSHLKAQKKALLFSVYEGESGLAVINRLETEKLIKSSLLFKIFLKLSNEPLKKGSYKIPPATSSKKILRILQSGESALVFLTIPEGKSLKGVAEIIEKKGFCSADEFLIATKKHPTYKLCSANATTYEGFIFPDSYCVPLGASAEDLLDIFYARFERIIESYEDEALQKKLRDKEWLYQQLILASIVEKEYKNKEEAPLIASVFQNRLRVGMRLESCATVIYVITDILHKKHPSRLYYIDLEIQNPYNTYQIKGLPPTPICSPGKIALDAVLNPTKSDYFYFVVEDPQAGTHRFSSHYSDHQKYQKDYVKNYFQ